MPHRAGRFADARRQFPAVLSHLYFNTARKGPLPDCTVAALTSFNEEMRQVGGNEKAWTGEVEQARAKVASLLHCETGEVAFCKNTSEGLNIAANSFPWKAGDNVVVPAGDHPNNVYPWLNLGSHGVDVRIVPIAKPWADASTLAPHVDHHTRAIALSHVTNHLGQRHDLADIANLCDAYGAHLIVDAVQSVGILDVDVRRLGISMLATGCHKGLLAPHGLGILYCRKNLIEATSPRYVARSSMRVGTSAGGSRSVTKIDLWPDARRFEYGNPNYSGIRALNASLELLLSLELADIEAYVMDLGRYLDQKMVERELVCRAPATAERHASIHVFELPGEGWEEHLRNRDVVVSFFGNTVRISLHFFNSREDIDQLMEVIDPKISGAVSRHPVGH